MTYTSNTHKAQQEGIASVYMLKAFCAMAVIAIHTPMGGLREDVNVLAALAVPLFFVITGYFLYTSQTNILRDRAKRSLKKLLPIILMTQMIYSVLPHSGFPLGRSFEFYIKWGIIGMNHNQVHLWYLSALATALLSIIILCRKHIWYYSIIALLALLAHNYLAALVFTNKHSIYWQAPICYWFRYAIATGMAYISIGMLIRRYQRTLLQFKGLIPISLALLILLYADHYIRGTSFSLLGILAHPILQACSVITIFTMCLRYPMWGGKSFIAFLGQQLSADIYYWHILVLWLVCKCLPPTLYVPWVYPLTIVGSIILALVLQSLYPWLRLLKTLIPTKQTTI